MPNFEIRVPNLLVSELQTADTLCSSSESLEPNSAYESFLPENYESLPIFSYNIDTTQNLTWDADAQSLHEIWVQKATTSEPHDRYPHAAIKRLMRLNPEVLQVCSEVLAPFSFLADMFVGMLLKGACGLSQDEQMMLTEKDVIHAIALNPLLTWAIDVIDVKQLLSLQPNEDPIVVANVLPELLVRQYPKNITRKLIEAHFKLLDVSDGPLGEIPVILDANGDPITKADVLGIGSEDLGGRFRAGHRPEIIIPNFVSTSIESQHESRDYVSPAQISLAAHITQTQKAPEFTHDFSIPKCSSNTMSESKKGLSLTASSSQMNFVNFFSHIDPIWFADEVDSCNFEAPLDFMNDGEIQCIL
jgi:hypothetical protein